MTPISQLFPLETDYSFLHGIEKALLLPVLEKIMIEGKLD